MTNRLHPNPEAHGARFLQAGSRLSRPALFTLLLVLLLALNTRPLPAVETNTAAAPPHELVTGVELARSVTEITGVAMSPMLGVSVVGAWRYFQTPDAHRAALPWFCHPYAWGLGFATLALCFLKDAVGTVSPPLLKKPLDVVELFENKASALIASAAFVPFAVARLGDSLPAGPQFTAAEESTLALAAVSLPDTGWLLAVLLIPPAVAMFLTVWLACHAINVLILICPFGFIDALLKLLKTGLLAFIVAAYALNPFLGAGVCLAIVLFAALIAPWTFRLTVFGTLCATDILLPEWSRSRACPDRVHAFLARRIGGVPVRTYGRLCRAEDGSLQFHYRPWLFLPRKTLQLPAGPMALSRGMFFSSLLACPAPGSPLCQTLVFVPRYRGLEGTVASELRIAGEIRDGGVRHGLKAMTGWVRETLGGGGTPAGTGAGAVPAASQGSVR